MDVPGLLVGYGSNHFRRNLRPSRRSRAEYVPQSGLFARLQPEADNDILQNVLEFTVSIDSPPGPLPPSADSRGGGRGDDQWVYRTMRMYLPGLHRNFHVTHEMVSLRLIGAG